MRRSSASQSRREQHLGLALEVDVRLAADVDGDLVDRAAGERVRRLARVVVGDRLAAVPADEERRAGDRERAELRLDPALADLLVAVVERERARRAGRLVCRPSRTTRTGSGSSPVGTSSVGDDHLLLGADEVVDVVEPVVLDVEGVAAEPGAWAKSTPSAPGAGMSTSAPITNERFLMLTRLPLRHRRVARVVDVPVPRRGELRPRRRQDLDRRCGRRAGTRRSRPPPRTRC